MSFTCADMERFYDWDMALTDKREAVAAAYAAQRFENETARAFATEGFVRRLHLLEDCVARAMEAFPPRVHWVPDRFAVREAVIYLQAFVVNVQGCTDNLAHIWVHEKGLTAEDGSALAGARVGFGPGNEAVLKSLSAEFAGYLRELGPWFEYLARFRGALEHHVPLYVRVSAVSDETLKAFAQLGERIGTPELDGDTEEADRLTRERGALVSFFPIVEHALGENAYKWVFHFQMMTDFETVANIARGLLGELG